MSKRIVHIISIFFITLLLAKGIGSATPLLFSGNDDTTQIELLSETEPEEQKRNGSKSVETSPTEELFDHTFNASSFVYIKTGRRIQNISPEGFLLRICLEIPTPPPNSTVLA